MQTRKAFLSLLRATSYSDHLHKAAWTFADQGVVSLGNFAINIFLARMLSSAEYGTFALLFNGLRSLQIINATLIFLPLSVRVPTAATEQRRQLLSGSIVLVGLACVAECLLMSTILFALGRSTLIGPSVTWFTLWQLQEAARRGLFANFRHKAAIPGDAISYLGQFAVVLILAQLDAISLTGVIYSLAATSGVAALLQMQQLNVRWYWGNLRSTVVDFWHIGRWALVNGLVVNLRGQFLEWQLAILAGTAAVGFYEATFNVITAVNPIMLGLGNIIPQTAASLQNRGNAYAWRSARTYAYLGLVPTFAYYAIVLAIPAIVLRIFYGVESPYLDLSDPLRVLAMAAIIGYGAEVISSFLQGANAAGLVLIANLWGTGSTLLLGIPLTSIFGLSGIFMALGIAHLIRLVILRRSLSQTVRAK